MNACRLSGFLFALALIAASCGSSSETTGAVSSDDADVVTTESDSDSDADADSDADGDAGDDDAADDDSDDDGDAGDDADSGDAGSGSSGAAPALEADVADEVYVELILDCVYGENEAGSCAELEAAGLTSG